MQTLLGRAGELLGNCACVYATGSFGRLEAGAKSDLDLFIVGKADPARVGSDGTKESQLKRLDEICIKAELIDATRKLKFPDFDGDGKYLAHYSVDELTKTLGKPEDDARNTLTGRLLLFLESRPLLGDVVYSDIIDEVIAAYWRDYSDHKLNFMPAYLTNDILRLWRTFCVNYEARTLREPEDKKLKGKIKNYKLKHSRMLTCYSALLYLLGVYSRHQTVSPSDASDMTKLTPTQRLEWIVDQAEFASAHEHIRVLFGQYELFLDRTGGGDEKLKEIFSDPQKGRECMEESYHFGDLMFEAMRAIGSDNRLFRLIVV
ncbi:MAG: hypothetical protein HQL38_07080 [Alphaproteobacteria bacterium]|nr:hypothetical protein [Alphaproteobacteria bacterium]